MTAGSTKVTSGRINGAGIQAGGPVPAPRVIGNRRIRVGGIALAAVLLLFGAALSGIALLSASRTSSYLAIARAVPAGSQIAAADLSSVALSGGSGLTLIPTSDAKAVVGQYARMTLVAGTLLSPGQLTNQAAPGAASQYQIGISIGSARLPSNTLVPGNRINLFPAQASGVHGANTPPNGYVVTIITISSADSSGTVNLKVAVNSADAATLLAINDNGGFSVLLIPGS